MMPQRLNAEMNQENNSVFSHREFGIETSLLPSDHSQYQSFVEDHKDDLIPDEKESPKHKDLLKPKLTCTSIIKVNAERDMAIHSIVKPSNFKVNSISKRRGSVAVSATFQLPNDLQGSAIVADVNKSRRVRVNFRKLPEINQLITQNEFELDCEFATTPSTNVISQSKIHSILSLSEIEGCTNNQEVPKCIENGDYLFNSLFELIKKETYHSNHGSSPAKGDYPENLEHNDEVIDDERTLRKIGKYRFRDYFGIIKACFAENNIELILESIDSPASRVGLFRKYVSILSSHILSNNFPIKRFHISLTSRSIHNHQEDGAVESISSKVIIQEVMVALKKLVTAEQEEIIVVKASAGLKNKRFGYELIIPKISPHLYTQCIKLIETHLQKRFGSYLVEVNLKRILKQIRMEIDDFSQDGWGCYSQTHIKKLRRLRVQSVKEEQSLKTITYAESLQRLHHPQKESPNTTVQSSAELMRRKQCLSVRIPHNSASRDSSSEIEGSDVNREQNISCEMSSLEWMGVGLNVKGIYDNGDNAWLEKDDGQGDWIVGYCSIAGYRMNSEDLNDYSNLSQSKDFQFMFSEDKGQNRERFSSSICGVGVVLLSRIDVEIDSQVYTCAQVVEEQVHGKKRYFRVALQCKIRANAVRVPEAGESKVYVVNDPKDVRPYSILLAEVTKQQKTFIKEKSINF